MDDYKEFGNFKGIIYSPQNESIEDYKNIKNSLSKDKILHYLKNLELASCIPIYSYDMYTNKLIKIEAGFMEDKGFRFPSDFIYYYENYSIGIPLDYENQIKDCI